jgi:hypothetical protein
LTVTPASSSELPAVFLKEADELIDFHALILGGRSDILQRVTGRITTRRLNGQVPWVMS